MHANDSRPRGRRHLTILTLGLAVAGLIVGCSPAPQPGSPPPSGAAAPSPTAPRAPSASTLPAPTSAPSAPPSPSASSLAVVRTAPTGTWSRLDWIAAGTAIPLGPTNVSVHGWSRGYIAFDISGGIDQNGNPTPSVVRSSESADGLRWSARTTLDARGLDNGVELAEVVEGPAGLLAVGNEPPGTCGGPAGLNALWRSSDGLTWQRVPLPKVFAGSRVVTVAGGSAGYLATGIRTDGSYRGIWASPDGVSWRTLPVPTATSGTVVVNDGTSFSGGLVLGGAILGPEGCGGPSSLHPSVWWSSDGQHWTQPAISGALTAKDASLTVERLSDRAVVAVETSSSITGVRAWVSDDGRIWTRVAAPASFVTWNIRTDGRRAALVVDPDSGSGPPMIDAVDDALTVTRLTQHGPGPVASPDSLGWTSTLGPTGILIAGVDGTGVWLGLPS